MILVLFLVSCAKPERAVEVNELKQLENIWSKKLNTIEASRVWGPADEVRVSNEKTYLIYQTKNRPWPKTVLTYSLNGATLIGITYKESERTIQQVKAQFSCKWEQQDEFLHKGDIIKTVERWWCLEKNIMLKHDENFKDFFHVLMGNP